MSLLFKNLRIHQVFGANTDVGKTIFTTALVRASASIQDAVFYLKPVSTGPMQDADDEHIKQFAGKHRGKVQASCLFRYSDPVSPHLAARLDAQRKGQEVSVPSDQSFVNSVAKHVQSCASRLSSYAHMYVETAGGIHSPTLSGTTQVDSYRPLFLPTILIGDSKLGGISSTISSYESLLLRGYIVDCIMLFRDEYYRNWEYLIPYFAEKGIHVATVDPPPPRLDDVRHNWASTENYYDTIVPSSRDGSIFDTVTHLDTCHTRRLDDLHSMPRRTLESIWWPFVQHGLVKEEKDVAVIDSASGDFFSIYKGHSMQPESIPSSPSTDSMLELQFDGSASWWTQTLGHSNASLALAAAKAAGRYGHVMFPRATHLPALHLAERLVHHGPGKGWATRAYFSDDGSTAMEVAIKMALRAYSVRNGGRLDSAMRKNLGILGLKGSYHGDTIGAMDACEEGVYTCEWHDAKGYWFDPPSIGIRNGEVHITLPSAVAAETTSGSEDIQAQSLSWAYNVAERLKTPLADVYRTFIRRTLQRLRESGQPPLAALIIEPLVMGAGGMIFVDPLFQRVIIDVAREDSTADRPNHSAEWSGLPVIFDEVFVGLYRLGMESCGPLLGVNPDISVNAKILTGGVVPLAVTLASDSIFQAFLSENKTEALLHGHSYTAHAVGCEVANETLRIVESIKQSDDWNVARQAWDASCTSEDPAAIWSLWEPEFVHRLSTQPSVKEVMSLGTVLVIKFEDGRGYTSDAAERLLLPIKDCIPRGADGAQNQPFGIHFRTLGNVAYFMTSLNTSLETVRRIQDRLSEALGPS
ncbi:hypothetical protein JAAARDRAFT_127738 [Jaapia argillacea MUCL 33604]|uniref:Dethiobiotin synthase n=1 Tax=Jaapia argillacea MUCL 33604 TaxID=933084 RepID=A0A067PWE9_9AGAM|nr:hypothetical protein JAAARDRAFT_127738 [Jaapia argillacea MUCL 33604]